MLVVTPPWQSLSLKHAEQPSTVQKVTLPHVLTWPHVPWVHESVVHARPSSQSVAFWQPTQPACASHSCPIAHFVLSGVWVQPFAVQASTVQSMLSVHSAALQQVAHVPLAVPAPAQHLAGETHVSKWQAPPSHFGFVWHEPAAALQSLLVVQAGAFWQSFVTSHTYPVGQGLLGV